MSINDEPLPDLTRDVQRNQLPDISLERLVDKIENEGTEFPVTFLVNGLPLSGQLVSHERYLERLDNWAATVRATDKGDDATIAANETSDASPEPSTGTPLIGFF